MSRSKLEEVAADALDRMPDHLLGLIDNLVIQIEERPDHETMAELGLDPQRDQLFGLYTGVPLDERGGGYGCALPDVVLLYRQPLLEACSTRSELLREIQLTLLHEIGHHLGLSDQEMESWEHEFELLEGTPMENDARPDGADGGPGASGSAGSDELEPPPATGDRADA